MADQNASISCVRLLTKSDISLVTLRTLRSTGKIWKLIATKKEIRDCFVISTILLLAGLGAGLLTVVIFDMVIKPMIFLQHNDDNPRSDDNDKEKLGGISA